MGYFIQLIQNPEGKSKEILDDLQAKLKKVPNIFQAMAHSPAALEALLAAKNALKTGVLDAKTQERIALAVGQVNDCDYCLAAHSAIGRASGLTPEELLESRKGEASDEKTAAIVHLAVGITKKQGNISEECLEKARAAGVTDEEICEVIAHVSVNIFTNYFNHIAKTEIDFPAAEPLA